MRKIVSAAVRLGPTIISAPPPARHHHLVNALSGLSAQIVVQPEDQGFLTNEGQFVQRVEARKIAEGAGQLLPRQSNLDELFSEDVW